METLFKQLLMPLIVALVSSGILLVVRVIAFRLLRRWDQRSGSVTGDLMIGALKTPSLFWAIAVGVYGGIATSDLHDRHVLYFSKIIDILLIFSITLVVSRLSGQLFRRHVQKANLAIPATGLATGILSGIIVIVGLLIILSVIGISITPLITALGVGGLAVALALKDTLENLFAGIHILVEKSIRVGDFIRLEAGQEGYVEDITWRTTRIRMLANNMVVIPNNKLAQSIVTNYYLPRKEMSLDIQVPVSYGSDIEKIERVLAEEAGKAVGEVRGLLGEPGPEVRYIPGFGERAFTLSVGYTVGEFADQYPVQNELRKRILRRFRKEGIEMPSPTGLMFLEKPYSQEQRAQG